MHHSLPSIPPNEQWLKSTKKRFHNKTRNGCLNCKRRRVRCTEERPSCKACARQKRECIYSTQHVNMDVRRLQTGQVIIIPSVSQQLLPPHYDSARISFYIENSIPCLTRVGPLPKAYEKAASLFVRPDGELLLPDASQGFDSLWRLFMLPAGYTEPLIFEQLALLAERHRTALTDSVRNPQLHQYSKMLWIMSKIIKTCSTDTALLGCLLFFAYERLQSAATGAKPLDNHSVHYLALRHLLNANPSDMAMTDSLQGVFNFMEDAKLFFTLAAYKGRRSRKNVMIPYVFEDTFQARDTFFDILENLGEPWRARKLMQLWESAMLRMHDNVRGKDWNQSKQAVAVMMEFQLLRTAFELAMAGHGNPGVIEQEISPYPPESTFSQSESSDG